MTNAEKLSAFMDKAELYYPFIRSAIYTAGIVRVEELDQEEHYRFCLGMVQVCDQVIAETMDILKDYQTLLDQKGKVKP